MDQLPPDSHWARRSHTEPEGADGAEAPVFEDSLSEVRSVLRVDLVLVVRFSEVELEEDELEELEEEVLSFFSGSGAGRSLVPLATTSVTGSAVTFSDFSSDSVTLPSTTVSVKTFSLVPALPLVVVLVVPS